MSEEALSWTTTDHDSWLFSLVTESFGEVSPRKYFDKCIGLLEYINSAFHENYCALRAGFILLLLRIRVDMLINHKPD
jgi:hypothetical protein